MKRQLHLLEVEVQKRFDKYKIKLIKDLVIIGLINWTVCKKSLLIQIFV